MDSPKVLVFPCSGVDKPLGSVMRRAAHILAKTLRPETVATPCLGMVIAEDEEILALIKKLPCIPLDGCEQACARRTLEDAGGRVTADSGIEDIRSNNGDFRTGSVMKPDDALEQLASLVAEKVNREVDRLVNGEDSDNE